MTGADAAPGAADCRMAAFAKAHGFSHPDGYDELWRWSVEAPDAFWRAVWRWFELTPGPVGEALVPDASAPGFGVRWFPQSQVNYAARVLAWAPAGEREHAVGPDRPAIIGRSEDGGRTVVTWAELGDQVRRLAGALTAAGVGVGDRVVAYLPDIAEANVAALAAASVGAVWASCGADYAPEGAASRLAQLAPTVLVVADGYRLRGRWYDKRADDAALAALLPTVTTVVGIRRRDDDDAEIPWRTADYAELAATGEPREPVLVPFAHPLWVLFSSGTTGKPKGIVHGHGGTLLEHLKSIALHSDVGAGDVYFWHTALSWMMWNLRLSVLLHGATLVCYDGHPLTPPDALWRIVADERVGFFGTSPGHLQACREHGVVPADLGLAALRGLGATGAPLAASLFEWIAGQVSPDVEVSSISGGTDVVSAFVGGSTGLPVTPGELTVPYLGVDVHSWAPDGTALIGEVGELVVTSPMPSMPVCFWNDPDGERYRAAYFVHDWGRPTARRVWRHGDWVTRTERGSFVIHGRSDATLNRGGIRMGSADVYEIVEAIEGVAEAFVLGVDLPDDGYWMPLFVTLTPRESGPADDGDGLVERIRAEITARLSRRHLPDEIVVAPGIPHTRTGKKLEVPVTGLLAGRDVAIDPSAVDAPELLDWYVEYGRRRTSDS